MKWNPFNLISPAIDKTKVILFPFKFWEWFKLMIISVLASSKGWGNYNFSNTGNSWRSERFGSFEDFSEYAREFIKKFWIFGTLILGIVFVLGAIISYIRSVFSFIFIESLVNKKARFTFDKNSSKGASLFWFKFLISIISLIILGALGFPYIYSFIIGNPIIATVGISYIVFSILAAVLYMIFLWVLFLFFYDFAVPYMYAKNAPAWFSLKQVWKSIRENKLETFVYWLSRIVLGIVIAIIAIIIMIVVLVIFGIIGGVIFLIGFLLYKMVGGLIVLGTLGILLGAILIILFFVTIGIIMLPFSVFGKYFELLNFEELTKIKILKK